MEDQIRWKIRSKQKSFYRLIEKTKCTIESALFIANFCLSWSGGKDSTALVHLVKSIDKSIPIITQFDDCDWPEKRTYIDQIKKIYDWSIIEVYPDFSVWDYAQQFSIGHDNVCAQSHNLTKKSFIEPLDKAREELKCNGTFMGLRASESHPRAMNLYSRGPLYQLKSKEWRCCPLWRWEVIDVFAYHAMYDIPINPCYLNNRIYTPEEIRISWAFPRSSGKARGDMEHLRIYYPEQYRRLKNKDGSL